MARGDMDYVHAEAAYKAYCREMKSGSERLTSESRQITPPVAWEWLTTIEKSAWLCGVSAALAELEREEAASV